MNFFYAQIDANKICFAISQLARPKNKPGLIPLDYWDESVLGKQWTGSEWVEPSKPE